MKDEEKLLTAEEANKLLASADGTAALLYLHILTSGGFSLTAAAGALRCGEAEVARAADTLRRLGLLEKPKPPLPADELPPVRTEDVVARAETDGAFRDVVTEAEKTLGRILSAHDLQTLFGLYDTLGLPADVIMLLLHHCVEEYQARSGPGRMPTMRWIEKEGWFWAQQEIMNIDAAEAHLQRCREKKEEAAQAAEVLQIRDRDLTKSMREYIERWLALGFGPEALAIAYDRTMLRTGRLNWSYMDKILESWDGKGLHSPAEIEEKDPAQRARRAAAAEAGNDEKIRRMQKVLNDLNKAGGKGAK